MICKHRSSLVLPPSPLTEAQRRVAHIIVIHVILAVFSFNPSIFQSFYHPSLHHPSLYPSLVSSAGGKNLNFTESHWRFGLVFAQFAKRGELGFLFLALRCLCFSLLFFKYFFSGLLSPHCHSSQELKISISLRSLALPSATVFTARWYSG